MKIIKTCPGLVTDYQLSKYLNALGLGHLFRDLRFKNEDWIWGIDDQGKLYGKISIIDKIGLWCPGNYWCLYDDLHFCPPIREMMNIIREFGNLLIFI